MTCREMNAALDKGALTGAAAEHAAQCEKCARLVRALERGADAATPGNVAAIQAALLADMRPVRVLAAPGFYLAALVAVFAGAVALGIVLLHPTGWPVLSAAQRAAVFLPLAGCAVLLALWLERQMTPGRRYGAALGLAAAALAAVLAGAMATVFHPAAEEGFVAHGLVCLRAGLLFALPVGLAIRFILSRGAVLQPARVGAALGLLAGLAGLAVLETHCPDLNAFHIWVWHGLVVVVSTIAGLAAGRLLYKV